MIIGVGIGLALGKYYPKQISSYEECVKANGNQIQPIYPGICATKDGRSFREVLTDEEKKNLQPLDPTANWKTYTDSRFDFSVKYPEDWKTIPFQDKWEPGVWLILAYSPDSRTNTINGEIVGVVESQSTSFSVSAYDESQVTIKDLEKLALEKNSKKTEQTINQIKGLLIVNEERTGVIEKLFVFEKENYTFSIQLFWPKNKLENEKILDQILTTFRFSPLSADLRRRTNIGAEIQPGLELYKSGV